MGEQLGEEEWVIKTSGAQIISQTNTIGLTSSEFVFTFNAHRHTVYYLARLFIPMLIILMVSWATFQLKDYLKRGMQFSDANLSFINYPEAKASPLDRYGHSYFRNSPAVSSDLVLLLRDDLDPGPPADLSSTLAWSSGAFLRTIRTERLTMTRVPPMTSVFLPPQRVAAILALLLLLSPTLAVAAQKKVTAGQLVEGAERAVAVLIRSARQSRDPALSSTSERAKPFWNAIRRLNTGVDQMATGLRAKKKTFFYGLGDAVSAGHAAAVGLAQSGAWDGAVSKDLSRVQTILGVLERSFGKTAVRKKQGGELTAAERRQLAEVRRKQEELHKKLNGVQGKVAGNRAAINGISRIREYSDSIYYSRNTVADFVAALITVQIVDGLLWGWHWWWAPHGVWVEHYSLDVYGVYHDTIDVIDYDWGYAQALVDVELEGYALDEAVTGPELEANEAYLGEVEDTIVQTGLDEIGQEAIVDGTDEGVIETLPEIPEIDTPIDGGPAETLPAEPVDEKLEGLDAEQVPAVEDLDLDYRNDIEPPVATQPIDEPMDTGVPDYDAYVDSPGAGGFEGGGFDQGGFDDASVPDMDSGFDMDMGGGEMDMDMGGGDFDF